MTAETVHEHEHEAVVVGGGFAGVGAAIRLREAGIEDFVLLEKASQLGGTWRDNSYPGCACDVPSTLYSYSFAPNPDWSRVFARQEEIQRYLLDTASSHGVDPHVRLDTELLEAEWDAERERWRLETSNGRYEARFLIIGAGPLHEPVVPDLPGLGTFTGKVFHSARWDHDHDLTGERVAVVGTGASAIQFVPRIRRSVAQLHIFQRTAPWVIPKADTRIPGAVKTLFRRVPLTQRALRAWMWGWMEVFTRAAHHPRAVRPAELYALSFLRREIRDPELRAALTPTFTFGCKRILLSNSWYRSLREPHVELVPQAVSEIRERSVVAADGTEREVDTIIFGTGFHVTDLPIADRIRGKAGRTLADTWQGSPRAYKGTTISGFPNAFMLFGPNIGVLSAFALIEAQLDYVMDALRVIRHRGLGSVDVRPEAQERYNRSVERALEGSIWNAGGCDSYYLDVTGRNASVWPWTVVGMRRRLRRFDLAAYRAQPAGAEASEADAHAAGVL